MLPLLSLTMNPIISLKDLPGMEFQEMKIKKTHMKLMQYMFNLNLLEMELEN